MSGPQGRLRAIVLQDELVAFDLAATLDKIDQVAAHAIGVRCDLMVFPEAVRYRHPSAIKI